MEKVKYSYKSLGDFLISKELSIDYIATDGWGGDYPVKGCEIDATILFADISSFSKRTINISSTATLVFVNHFFSWITGEALQNVPCIIDKYIGDEIMIIFSNEFGTDNHFAEALKVAKGFIEFDEWGFSPHIGISSGIVTVGYVGTPKMYSCSVFGKPVTLAARCVLHAESGMIVIAKDDWHDALFETIFISRKEFKKNSSRGNMDKWNLSGPENVEFENIGQHIIYRIKKEETMNFIFTVKEDGSLGNSITVEEHIIELLKNLKASGKYKPLI